MGFSGEEWAVGDLLAPEIAELLEAGENHLARESLMELLPPEIGDVLVALPSAQRAHAFRLLGRGKATEVFLLLPPEEQEKLLTELNNEQLANLFNSMEPDDRAQLFEELPGQVSSRLLSLMKPEERRRTQIILGYPPESVGRVMTPDYLTLREEWTVQQALDHIRRHGAEVETFNTLFVIDDRGRLLDDLRLRLLILANPQQKVSDLLDGQVVSLRATDDREEAVRVMERYDRPQIPVIDRENMLVGMVTFDDIADVAEEEVTEDIQKLGGMQALEEPYLEATVVELVRKRVGWLAILFGGGMLTVTAMRFFNNEIQKYATLAFFVPLIIASGGNSGSQAATLMIRSLALGELKLADWLRVLRRELASGLLLGTALGVLGFLVSTIATREVASDDSWFAAAVFGFVVGTSVVGVVTTGTIVGAMLPFILSRFGLDPATSSTPFVATIVDVAGLVIYFGTAHLLLSTLM